MYKRQIRGAAEQDEDGRQEGQRAEYRAGDADRADRPERPVVGQVAEQKGEQAEGHRRRTGHHRAPGLPERGPHGEVPVGPQGQFLPVAGGEQQGVVGGGADHEDGEDSLDLSVHPYDLAVGQGVDDGAGKAQREDSAEDDHEGQQQAAVDQQQDDQDGGQGHGQQQSVDAGEGVGQVCLTGGRPGQPDRGARHGLGGAPDPVEGVGEAVAEVGPELDHALECRSVPRKERGRHLAHHSRGPAEGRERAVGRVPQACDAAVAVGGPDDDRRQCLLLPEGALLVDHLGGLGAAGQEGGLVVGRDLTESPREGAEGAADPEPEEQQQDGNEAAGRPGARTGRGGHLSPAGISMKNNLND